VLSVAVSVALLAKGLVLAHDGDDDDDAYDGGGGGDEPRNDDELCIA